MYEAVFGRLARHAGSDQLYIYRHGKHRNEIIGLTSRSPKTHQMIPMGLMRCDLQMPPAWGRACLFLGVELQKLDAYNVASESRRWFARKEPLQLPL